MHFFRTYYFRLLSVWYGIKEVQVNGNYQITAIIAAEFTVPSLTIANETECHTRIERKEEK